LNAVAWRRNAVAILVLSFLCIFSGQTALAQSGSLGPVRWDAQSTQIYFDNIDTAGPALGPGFLLDAAGSLTSNPSEVISGAESIKGSYSGTGSYTRYLETDPSIFPFLPNHSYRVTFQYKILTAPSTEFSVLFFSPTAAGQGNFLPDVTITGAAGTTGTATLTNTLGPFTDYRVYFEVDGTGAIAVDNIQLIDQATGTFIATENAEGTAPNIGSGLQLLGGASITTDPNLVIGGKASILIPSGATVTTNPAVVPLLSKSTYIVEFDYRILTTGSGDKSFFLSFDPPGPYNQQQAVTLFSPLRNAPSSGHFSTGALTNVASSYVLYVGALPGWSVVIDNVAINLLSPVLSSTVPSSWGGLARRPFPRLGNVQQSTTEFLAEYPFIEPPFTYSVNQIESRLAFADVIAELMVGSQSESPASISRLRRLNPNAVILPYRIAQEQNSSWSQPVFSDIDPDYDFFAGFADAWYARDTLGNYVPDNGAFGFILKANISPFCPVINGDTYVSYLSKWLNNTVFPSGLWDGIYIDNLFARINPHILNADNPATLNYDWNLNGIRDETPASSSEMTRQSAINFLTDLQSKTRGGQILIGNAGPLPEISLAPYVNGYLFECFNQHWNSVYRGSYSAANWRQSLDTFLAMQNLVLRPQTIILEGCGETRAGPPFPIKVAATPDDIYQHRFSMGTALLGDAFYEYDIWDSTSAPYWFDEYSVDSGGTAVEDSSKKGYLGSALTEAVELAGAAGLLYSQDFESGRPPSLTGTPANAVFISSNPGQVISGNSSLIISNPDHTQQATTSADLNVATGLAPGSPALIRVKWRVTQTLDGRVLIGVSGNASLDNINPIGVVAGDSGTATIPIAALDSGNLSLHFVLLNGGGEVAIDDIQVFSGGVGPWRRDFEKGFVLVNPFNQPHTFSAADLTGALKRTNIRRIKGTQAPDLNNGQAVTGSLTLGAFDAIILLADPINAPKTKAGQITAQ
jgi:hypothetical protein